MAVLVRHGLNRAKGAWMRVCHARAEYVRWLLVTRDLSPHTIRAYDGDIAMCQRYMGEGAVVGDIDRERVVAFVEALRAASLSPKSVRRRASGLRGFAAGSTHET